jgi:Flp pilus assembly protein TadD
MLFLVDDLLTPQEVQRELQARPSAGLYFAQSRHLLRQRKVATADEALVKALQLAPWDKFLMIESIRVAEALDNPAQLMDRVSQLLLQEPGEIRTVLNLRLFSNYSQPIPGLKALAQRVYVRFPERAEGWILRALDELQNGRLDPAKEACQMALRCAESQASARLLQGVTLEHMGRSEAAQTAYFLSHALDPSDPRPLIGIASVWLQRGNPNLAEATFRELARLGAAPQHVVRGQTEVLLAKGRTLAAIRYLESQLDAFPDELELISLRGMLAWQVGRPADAEIWFQKVLSRDPRHLVARINLGQIQLSQRKVTQGLATLKEALAIAPNDPTLLQVYGVALLRNGQLAEAESILLRASEVQPNEPRVIAALGSMYLESNRLKEAHTLLSRITEIHPQNPQLRLVYGQTLLRMHRYTEAVNQMERAQRMISSDSPNYAPVAMQLNQARQFVKMERRLDDVLAGTIKPSITETIDLIEMYAHAKQKPVDAAEWAVRFLLANERHRFGPGQNVYLRAGVLALQASRATEQTDPAQSHRWRRQALSYLDRQRRQWIEAVNEKAASAESLQANRKRLNTMPELRNVRDPAEQKKLPSDEAAAWKKLFDWANETPPREVLPSF